MELKHSKRNIWIIGSSVVLILLAASLVFYWKLVRLGYAVPIPYILDVFCLNNCPIDSVNVLHAQLPPDNLLNYDRPLTQILGAPDKLDKKRSNWTLGCISLENRDVEELYQFVQKGTAVEIIP